MNNTKTAGSFLAGTLVGGLIGAAVALLYAPRSGEETRTVIREKSVELKDKAVERGEEIVHRAEEVASQTKERLEATAQATRERAAELQTRGQSFLDEQRERITHAVEAGRKTFQKKGAEPVLEVANEPQPTA